MKTAFLLTALSLPLASINAQDKPGKATRLEGQEWPQFRGPTRDGVWRETGLLEEFPTEFKPRWTAAVGSGYSGPTVAGGRVFVMDRQTEATEIERVLCFDASNGKRLWKHEYEAEYGRVSYKAGPRCSVVFDAGRAYSLGTMGHLFCLDANNGSVVWSKDLDKAYQIRMPIWGVAATPVIEGNLLIVPACGKDACLVAFDKKTGQRKWKALSDRGNYAAPIVIDQAKRRVVVLWTGDRVVGVLASSGELAWEYPFKAKRMPLGVASPVLHGNLLFLTGFYDGCLMLRLAPDKLAVEKVWRRRGPTERKTDGLHSIISTPVLLDEHIYGVDSYGEFRCLKLMDGARVWEDQKVVPRSRWATIHFTQNGDRTVLFTERGDLVFGKLSPKGFDEIDRRNIITPTRDQLNRRGGVCWSPPAFAYKHVFVRSDAELCCYDLSKR